MRKALILALLLAGCGDPADAKFKAAFAELDGQPIYRLVSRWGKPDAVSEAADNAGPVYIWLNKGQYSGNTQSCRVAVLVGPQERIRGIKLTGIPAACRHFADLL